MTVTRILPRYVTREFLVHAFAALAIVVGIFLVRTFSSLLGDLAEATLPIPVILHLLSLRTVMALSSLLPIVLYAAALLALSRLYRDNEMTGFAACGISPWRIHTTVLVIGFFGAVLTGMLSFLVRPWAAGHFAVAKDQAVSAFEMDSMMPGRFYEIDSGGEQVVFAESRSSGDSRFMERVFVQHRDGDQLSIFYSDQAVEYRDEHSGYRFLRLLNGYRYDLIPDEGDYDITRYEELTIRTRLPADLVQEELVKARSTHALADSLDRHDRAEFQWRASAPVSVFLLVLLAIPLSHVEPRRGKTTNLFFALLAYVVYRHLLGTAKGLVASGALPPIPGVWAVHALCLATALLLLARERRRWRSAVTRPAPNTTPVSHQPATPTVRTGDPLRR